MNCKIGNNEVTREPVQQTKWNGVNIQDLDNRQLMGVVELCVGALEAAKAEIDKLRSTRDTKREQYNGDRIAEMLPDTELLQADGFDEAIIGYAEVWTGKGHGIVMAYDRDKCIDVLVDRDGMERDEAVEYFQFNVAGASVGEMTPCFVTTGLLTQRVGNSCDSH